MFISLFRYQCFPLGTVLICLSFVKMFVKGGFKGTSYSAVQWSSWFIMFSPFLWHFLLAKQFIILLIQDHSVFYSNVTCDSHTPRIIILWLYTLSWFDRSLTCKCGSSFVTWEFDTLTKIRTHGIFSYLSFHKQALIAIAKSQMVMLYKLAILSWNQPWWLRSLACVKFK